MPLTVETLDEYARSVDPSLRLTAAKSRRTPSTALISLTSDSEYSVKKAAIANPSLPHSRLWELVADASASPRRIGPEGIIANPTTTNDMLVVLNTPRAYQHKNLSHDVMREIADPTIGTKEQRKALVDNPALPDDVQQTLAQDPLERIRLGLARNRNITEAAARILLVNSGPRVLRALSGKRAAAPIMDDILARLSGTTKTSLDPVIVQHTTDRNYIIQCLNGHSILAQRNAFKNPNFPVDLLEDICASGHLTLAGYAMAHPACPETAQVMAALRGARRTRP